MRKTSFQDASAINSVVSKCYPDVSPYPVDALRAHINHFPEGQMVVEYDGKVIGFCITFIINEEEAMKPHTWKEITGSAFASRHDPMGGSALRYGYLCRS